jgi:hypothetical protein
MPWVVMGVERDRVVTALEKQGTGTPRCTDIPTHGCVLWTAYTAGTVIRHNGQLPVAGRQAGRQADCRTFRRRKLMSIGPRRSTLQSKYLESVGH